MEIIEVDFLSSEAEGVVAVLFSLEAEGQLALVLGVDDGVVLAVLRDIDLRVVLVELELGQLVAFIETHDGAVDGGATFVGEVHD